MESKKCSRRLAIYEISKKIDMGEIRCSNVAGTESVLLRQLDQEVFRVSKLNSIPERVQIGFVAANEIFRKKITAQRQEMQEMRENP